MPVRDDIELSAAETRDDTRSDRHPLIGTITPAAR